MMKKTYIPTSSRHVLPTYIGHILYITTTQVGEFLKTMQDSGKIIAAICAAPMVLLGNCTLLTKEMNIWRKWNCITL